MTVIVADTNIIVYFFLSAEHSSGAQQLFQQEGEWAVPPVWKSEFRNSLVLYLRKGLLPIDEARSIQARAELMLESSERPVNSDDVLRLASTSKCSAYDCEFVALAEDLGLRLVTEDKQILREFPSVAISLADAIA